MGGTKSKNQATFCDDIDDDISGQFNSVRLRGNAEPIAIVERAFKLMEGEVVEDVDENSGETKNTQLTED